MKKLILNIFLIAISLNSYAYKNVNLSPDGNGSVHNSGDDRAAGCTAPNDLMYLNYNNVKALIMTGGMMWQDRASSNASYIVDNPQKAHVIYAGALWMGGLDVNDQLKLAAQTFGTGRDFYTGPLSTFGGASGNYDPSVVQTADLDVIRAHGDAEIISSECNKYDRFYTIRKREVIEFDRWWQCNYGSNPDPTVCEQVEDIDPEVLQRILDWPAHGDEALGQDKFLAPFFDRDGDNFYDPIGDGDYPWYDINGEIDCRNDRRVTLFGDETNWWVFNDKGNIHGETGGDPIGMEVRAQAFAFATNDAINDMTFYNYEMINRSTQTLKKTYFAQYVDPDIGGSTDDYVGCDVSRGLGYAYNGDANDNGAGGVVFGAHPPAIGIDFFEGPYQDLDQLDNPLTTNVQDAIAQKGIPYDGLGLGYGDGVVDNERLGMRRFFYYTNGATSPMDDPSTAAEFYGFMKGFWQTSGIPITYGGDGNGGSIVADYCFPGTSDPLFWGTKGVATSPWSEESEGNPAQDRRFAEVAGPFTLRPGAVNNITVGVVYGRDLSGDNLASVDVMKANDSKAQSLFDACFQIVQPPYAPDLTVQEMENELILYIADKGGIIENFKAIDKLNIPKDDGQGNLYDQYYRFQGYQIFQMVDDKASVSDLDDPTKAILVAQCDLEDNVTKLVNYTYDEQNQIPVATVKVNNAENAGIRHSFHITEDQFAQGNKKLVNHKKYYFIAIAYAYNEFKHYDPFLNGALDGQKIPYLGSNQSISGGSIRSIEAIPHNPAPEAGGTIFGTYYGYQPKITQLDGTGNGGAFLEIDEGTEKNILENNTVNSVTYKAGNGPIGVKVIDPLNLQNGTYTLSFPNNATDQKFRLNDSVKWTITREFEGVTESITSPYGIGRRNELLIPEWGISVDIRQIKYQGKVVGKNNIEFDTEDDCFITPIGGEMIFEDSSKVWIASLTDIEGNYPLNWIRVGTNNVSDGCDKNLWFANPCYYNDYLGYDPNQDYEKILDGGIAPLKFCNYGVYGTPFGGKGSVYTDASVSFTSTPFQPGLVISNLSLKYVHDVDIVITSDKTKWTRCPVFEINDNENQTVGGADQMDLRQQNSVDTEGNDDGTGIGMGWFPGYAIDLNTGERLNMAFSENSWLTAENGNDMIWNPTSRFANPTGVPIFGGMHYVYVFGVNNNMPAYDEGKFIHNIMSSPNYVAGGSGTTSNYRKIFESTMWVWEPIRVPGKEMLETDVRIKVRINRPYETRVFSPKSNNGRPLYQFVINDSIRVITQNTDELKSALDLINIVPNPYYAYSSYEFSRLDTRVKITNLPEQCEVTIFNMQGALVRQFSKDDPLTSLDWDLKNYRGIPIASGVYIIHVNVPGAGEKILKWYGVLREGDLQGF